MRLGLVGASGDLAALARALRTAVRLSDRVVYLASDPAFDDILAGWVALLHAEGPLCERAAAVLDADGPTLAKTIAAEVARRELANVQSLSGASRAVEILLDRVVLLATDKTDLDEEDLLPASVIAFGRGDALVRRVGSRVFVAPGPPSAAAGVAVLAEEPSGASLTLTLFTADGDEVQSTSLDLARAAKLRVQGAIG